MNPARFIDPFGLRSITYDGCRIRYFDDAGNQEKVCPATSGRPGTGVGDHTIVDKGPIPEGQYQVFGRECSGGGLKALRRRFTGDWGNYRVPLHPSSGTRIPKDRDPNSFFFHGGRDPGSAGCIDVGGCDTYLCNWLRQKPNDPVDVYVWYATGKVCN
jgi:hypothetical protein